MTLKKYSKTLNYFNYNEMIDIVEEKNKIDVCDYLGWSLIMNDQYDRVAALKNEKFGMTYEQRDAAWAKDDPRWSQYNVNDILREGELHFDEVGYKDYWHFMLDQIEVHNGIVADIDFADILESAIEEDTEDGGRAWRTEITNMIIAEVGLGSNKYLIEW